MPGLGGYWLVVARGGGSLTPPSPGWVVGPPLPAPLRENSAHLTACWPSWFGGGGGLGDPHPARPIVEFECLSLRCGQGSHTEGPRPTTPAPSGRLFVSSSRRRSGRRWSGRCGRPCRLACPPQWAPTTPRPPPPRSPGRCHHTEDGCVSRTRFCVHVFLPRIRMPWVVGGLLVYPNTPLLVFFWPGVLQVSRE